MASQHPTKITDKEAQLIEAMRRNPALTQRVERIVEIAQANPDEPRKADHIEEELIEAIRELGNSTMQHWAQSRGQQIEAQAREEKPGTYRSKKRAKVVLHLRLGADRGVDSSQLA